MKEIIGEICTVGACSTMFLSYYYVMKQRDEIRDLILEKESKKEVTYDVPNILKESQLLQDLWDEIEVLRNQCLQNPHNIQFLKRSALALTKMTHMYGGELRLSEARQMLKEAKSKLKKVLEADQDDQEAIFELGVAHFYLYKFDRTLNVKRRISYCMKAVECFETVGEKAPESYIGSNMLQKSQSYLRFEAPEVESSEMGEMGEMDEMDDEMHDNYHDIIKKNDLELHGYERDCEAAEMWNSVFRDDVYNLRRWGSALIGSFLCGTIGDMTDKELLEGAIEKLNKALLLEPDDINTKLQLARARLFNCYDLDGPEAKDLYKKCLQLDAELCALSKLSPMVLNKMDHVAVVSEEERIKRIRIARSKTSIFNLSSPKAIEPHQKNNPRMCFPVGWPMRSGAPRLCIPAAAMQMHGLRTAGIRSCGTVAPILRLVLHQLISRK